MFAVPTVDLAPPLICAMLVACRAMLMFHIIFGARVVGIELDAKRRTVGVAATKIAVNGARPEHTTLLMQHPQWFQHYFSSILADLSQVRCALHTIPATQLMGHAQLVRACL